MQQIISETGFKPLYIENALRWRNAARIFDPYRIIPDDKFELLLEALRLSPSSMNLQPWKFIIVKNKTVRQQIQRLAMNQPAITEASHLLILCSLKTVDGGYFDRLVQLEKLNSGQSALESFKPVAMSFIESKSKEELKEWLAQQVYIALGFLLCSCALMHVDSCPIEGFDHAKVNKLLDLHKQGMESRVAVALGYRPVQQGDARTKKIRWPKEEVITTI